MTICIECGSSVEIDEDGDWADPRGEVLCPASDMGRGPVAYHNVGEK